jgi:hypothetical protein
MCPAAGDENSSKIWKAAYSTEHHLELDQLHHRFISADVRRDIDTLVHRRCTVALAQFAIKIVLGVSFTTPYRNRDGWGNIYSNN